MKPISDELRKVADEYDVLPLYGLADRIDSEMIELPKDADGVPIRVGETVYDCKSGRQSQVFGLTLVDGWGISTNNGLSIDTSGVTHERPDSWDRIVKDLNVWAEKHRDEKDLFDQAFNLAFRIRKLANKEGER